MDMPFELSVLTGGEMSELPRILIVDHSRVVRASLAKYLRGRFAVVEAADGESAWHALVLDSRIVGVVSGRQMQRLDGYGLLERLRGSRLHRLRDMPFLLIVSDDESEHGKTRAQALGVSGFITKLMGRAEILARLDCLLGGTEFPVGETRVAARHDDLIDGAILRRVGQLTDNPLGGAAELLPDLAIDERLLTAREIQARISAALAHAKDRRAAVSVLVLGIDNYDELVAQFGRGMAKRIGVRFGRLLQGKIGPCDSIGQYGPDRYVIVSREANVARCHAFAGRICRSMATAQIAVRGRPARMAICAGAAGVPEEAGLSGEELLALAVSRMETARCSCGAGRTAKGTRKEAAAGREIPALRPFASLLADRPEALVPLLGTVGLQMLPFLKMLEREFRFGLPLPEMETRLAERARREAPVP